jgi:hypothetical protein
MILIGGATTGQRSCTLVSCNQYSALFLHQRTTTRNARDVSRLAHGPLRSCSGSGEDIMCYHDICRPSSDLSAAYSTKTTYSPIFSNRSSDPVLSTSEHLWLIKLILIRCAQGKTIDQTRIISKTMPVKKSIRDKIRKSKGNTSHPIHGRKAQVCLPYATS